MKRLSMFAEIVGLPIPPSAEVGDAIPPFRLYDVQRQSHVVGFLQGLFYGMLSSTFIFSMLVAIHIMDKLQKENVALRREAAAVRAGSSRSGLPLLPRNFFAVVPPQPQGREKTLVGADSSSRRGETIATRVTE
jgi:hypothetical protein